MYLMDEIILEVTKADLLKDWSEDRKHVFLNLNLGMPKIDTPDHLNGIAKRINKIKEKNIKTITKQEFDLIN